ncbi:MAG TPA: response regulator [Microvirga sp.]|jgi:two-component system chemotaxis response regulator CheY|nr:response regulator [Microvirga sp.]
MTPLSTSPPVLIIDDQGSLVKLLTGLFRQIGYADVDHARDGISGAIAMARRRYALVLCDWTMEPVDGLTLIRAVRADEHLKDTPFLMMTARHRAEDIAEAKAAGVDGLISKPFTLEDLKMKVASLLGGAAGPPAAP